MQSGWCQVLMPALPPSRWQSRHIVTSLDFPSVKRKHGFVLTVYVVPNTHPGTTTLSLSPAQIFTYSELRVQNLLLYDFEESHK